MANAEITNPEIANEAISRAEEIKRFLSEKVQIREGEELNCEVFFEPSDGNYLHGTNTKDAVLIIYSWIGASGMDIFYLRSLPEDISYPDSLDHQRAKDSYVTVFDGYYLDSDDTEEVRNYRSSEINFTPDMYTYTSD